MEITQTKPLGVLLVEDNAGDVRLIKETLLDGKTLMDIQVARDGIEAMQILRGEGDFTNSPPIDLVMLDLNLPKRDGREVLAEIRADDSLKHIPVIILTSSSAEKDIDKAYDLYANCYVVKPIDLDDFINAVRSIEDFWLTIVKLPPTHKQTGK
jgi:chemotaxis family two-component system response regulator Rcp1